jgi:Zn-dependent membrane protease YugP
MVGDLYDPKQKQLKLLEEAWSASEISEAHDLGEP